MSEQERYLDELKEFLRIPSVSTDPNHKADVHRCAEWVCQKLEQAGLRGAQLIEGDGNPLVYAHWMEAPGKPTLLLYGHYDVQPPDPLDEWKSPPFEPEVRGDNIYARGAVDDKGQTLILIKAIERTLARTGKLPVNIRFLIEGEEEIGGKHIERFVSKKPATLKADAAVICDTEMFAPELPTICVGLRGIVYGELIVEVAEQDLHSGMFGGTVANPIMAIAEILTALKDRDGHINIPGFYDKIKKPTMKELGAWQRLPFDVEEFRKRDAKVFALTGEPDQTPLERMWARPTLEVHGIRGGFTGEGAKTVIPARALAKVSVRIVPDQTVDETTAQIQSAIAKACPKGVKAEFKAFHGGAPSVVDTDNQFVRAAAEAMKQVFGKETVYIRSGGSIPIVGLFQKHLGIPSVMMGFGLPDDNLHSPNEKFHLPNLYRGVDSVEKFLELLG
jgi:acetylornithine deacetylase/succinyl-diaminopimelate desuccinylase-like protein